MKTKLHYKIALLLISYALIFSGAVFAGTATVEGVIAGANCVVAKGTCPVKNDPHIALEQDFLLSVSDGKYYFLPNIPRSLKTRYLNKPVRITGDLNGLSLVVATIEVKRNGEFQEVWNWKEITNELNMGM
jgi:hypothetical protein